MKVIENIKLIKELERYKLCKLFWSEKITDELGKKIILEYEPIGEMGVYGKAYEFVVPYKGIEKKLFDTTAVINIKITAKNPEYNVQKAINDIDCYHNVWIKLIKNSKEILTCHFRLWSRQEEEYCGNAEIIKWILDL